MTRNLALVFLVTAMAFSGCKKLQMPGAKQQAEVEQQQTAGEVATPSEPAAPSAPELTPVADKTETPAAAAATTPEAPSSPTVTAQPVTSSNSQVVVLCYHRFEGKAGGSLSIDPALLKEQMQKIKDAGLSVITMKDFLAWKRGEKNIPEKSVLITIDDGYVSAYEEAWPILKEYGYPFTMFVYLKYINAGGKSMTWNQLAEMRDAGVEIGSHTVSHQDLRRKGKGAGDYESFLKQELEESKKVIEEKLGVRCATIAYPFGLHNEKVRAAVKEAGYEAGFTTYGKRLVQGADPYALGRYDVTTKDARGTDSFTVATSFEGEVSQAADPTLSQDAAASMVTVPMNDETIKDQTPTLKANLSTMGDIDPASVQMRISGVGLVKSKYDPATKMLTYTVPADKKLEAGSYRVIVQAMIKGRKAETGWNFKVDPNAAPSQESEAPLPPRKPQI